ncbi:hypothetical protein LguiA_006306 [Lonicera macranthoides]
MAAHCHHLNTHATTVVAAAPCCCCNCSRNQPHYLPPSPADPLLQSLTSHSHLFHTTTPHPHPYQNLPHNYQQPQYFPPQPQTHHHKQKLEPTHALVSSLLRRIETLESSLFHPSSHSSSSNYYSSHSLRQVAARTIQSHFRAFLVRRSRTLRQLQHLAFIKSNLNSLKSSVSPATHFDSRSLSHQVMDMLAELESIRGDDQMIRDGKRSISRELVRFMEFIEEITVKRHEILRRGVKNVRIGTKSRVLRGGQRTRSSDCRGSEGDERELMEKLRERVEKIHVFSRDEEENVELENPTVFINGDCGVSSNRNGGLSKRYGGVQAKPKKNVSFVDNGNVYRVFRPVSTGEYNGSDSIDDERELVYGLNGEVEGKTEEDEEAHMEEEEEGSSEISNDDGNSRRNLGADFNYEMRKQEDGSFVFSAPMPVKMEPRTELMNMKSNVRVAK